MEKNEQNLENLRAKIDLLDDNLLEILENRMQIVRQIGEQKAQNKAPIYRPEREKAILSRLCGKNENLTTNQTLQDKSQKDSIESSGAKLLNNAAICAIFQEIFAISRNLEKPERVAFLGPKASYSHQAAQSKFGKLCEYLPHSTIANAVQSAQNGIVKYAIIPIENNQNGAIGESLDLLKNTNLKIISEIYLPIHHCLASKAAKICEISKIYSKNVAFEQCSRFLGEKILENIKNQDSEQKTQIECLEVDSTAKAAEIAAQNPQSAAICSKIAAELYNLPILFENIENNATNKTRFVVLSDFSCAKSPNCDYKTSFFANLANTDRPGALASLLNDLKELGINMTSIQSRPNNERGGFSYCFFVDIDGHLEEPSVAELFSRRKDELKWLGSYPREINGF